MQSLSKTTTQLLEALHDEGDEAAWQAFDDRHRPIVFGVARRLGLGEEDAADVAQQSIVEFLQAYKRGAYDRDRGRLRSWLVGIARFRSLDALRRRKRALGDRGESAYLQVPAVDQLEELWDAEHERVLLDRAMKQLRTASALADRTLVAFEMVTIQGLSASAVADSLDLSVNEVYRIKHRVIRRLREITETLRAEHDGVL